MKARKYQEKVKNPHPHIGMLVKRIMEEKKISQAELARRMQLTPTSIVNYFKQSSLQFGILWNIGIALEHDFLTELTNYYPADITFNSNSKLVEELNNKTNQIKDLEKEIEIYKKALGIK